MIVHETCARVWPLRHALGPDALGGCCWSWGYQNSTRHVMSLRDRRRHGASSIACSRGRAGGRVAWLSTPHASLGRKAWTASNQLCVLERSSTRAIGYRHGAEAEHSAMQGLDRFGLVWFVLASAWERQRWRSRFGSFQDCSAAIFDFQPGIHRVRSSTAANSRLLPFSHYSPTPPPQPFTRPLHLAHLAIPPPAPLASPSTIPFTSHVWSHCLGTLCDSPRPSFVSVPARSIEAHLAVCKSLKTSTTHPRPRLPRPPNALLPCTYERVHRIKQQLSRTHC